MLQAQPSSPSAIATGTGGSRPSTRKPASWPSIGLTIPTPRVSRSNAPPMPDSGSTLQGVPITTRQAPVNDPAFREDVLEIAEDDLSPRFVTNVALHNLLNAVHKVTGDAGLDAMLASWDLHGL